MVVDFADPDKEIKYFNSCYKCRRPTYDNWMFIKCSPMPKTCLTDQFVSICSNHFIKCSNTICRKCLNKPITIISSSPCNNGYNYFVMNVHIRKIFVARKNIVRNQCDVHIRFHGFEC